MIIISHKNRLFEEFNLSTTIADKWLVAHGYEDDKKRQRLIDDLKIDVPSYNIKNWFYFPGIVRLYVENVNNPRNINQMDSVIRYIVDNNLKYDSFFTETDDNGNVINTFSLDDLIDVCHYDDETVLDFKNYNVKKISCDDLSELNQMLDGKIEDRRKFLQFIDVAGQYIYPDTNMFLCTHRDYLSKKDPYSIIVVVLGPMKKQAAFFLRNFKPISRKRLSTKIGFDLEEKLRHEVYTIPYTGIDNLVICDDTDYGNETYHIFHVGAFWGIKDDDGVILHPIYRNIEKIDDGFYIVESTKDKYGLYYSKGKRFLLPVIYANIKYNDFDVVKVTTLDHKVGLYNFNYDRFEIPCEYDEIKDGFADPLFIMRKGKLFGLYLDSHGKCTKLPCEYTKIDTSSNPVRIYKDKKVGIIDVWTGFKIPCGYSKIDWCHEQLKDLPGISDYLVYYLYNNGKKGIIMPQMNINIPCECSKVDLKSDGIKYYKGDKVGYVEFVHNIKYPCEYDDIIYKDSRQWSIGKYFILLKNGTASMQYQHKEIIPFGKYTNIEFMINPDSNEVAGLLVHKKDWVGVCDHLSGKEIVPCKFDSIKRPVASLYYCFEVIKDGKYGIWNAGSKKFIYPLSATPYKLHKMTEYYDVMVEHDNKFGLMSGIHNDKFLNTPIEFDYINLASCRSPRCPDVNWTNGIDRAMKDPNYMRRDGICFMICSKNGKYGAISEYEYKTVIPFEYDFILGGTYTEHSNIILAKKDGKCGAISWLGKNVRIPFEYDNIYVTGVGYDCGYDITTDHIILLTKGKKLFKSTLLGDNKVRPCTFEEMLPYFDEFNCIKAYSVKNGKRVVFNKEGRIFKD